MGVRTFRRHIQLHKDRIPRHRHPRRDEDVGVVECGLYAIVCVGETSVLHFVGISYLNVSHASFFLFIFYLHIFSLPPFVPLLPLLCGKEALKCTPMTFGSRIISVVWGEAGIYELCFAFVYSFDPS